MLSTASEIWPGASRSSVSSLDRFIAEFPAERDGDLVLCRGHGVAYQADREHVVCYDEAYFAKCAGYEGQEIAERINEARVALVARHVTGRLVDVGIGSGEFLRRRPNTWGYDVNPYAIEWLCRQDRWAGGHLSEFASFSFWDVLEHVPDPGVYFRHVPLFGFVFASLPIFPDLDSIRASKHYRPGEHLQYFTEAGFVGWMQRHGFRLLERNDDETLAGRESIYSFALQRYRWPK